MQEILCEIKFVPGILGSFFYAEKKGGALLRPARGVRRVPRTAGGAQGGGRLFHNRKGASKGIDSIDMIFDEAVITAHNMCEEVFVVVAGDVRAGIELTNMAIGTLRSELMDSLRED